MSSVKLSSGRDHQAGGGRVSIVGDVGIGRDSRRFGPVVIPPEPSVVKQPHQAECMRLAAIPRQVCTYKLIIQVPVLFLLPREG